MARPLKKTVKPRTNLTIDPAIKAQAAALAYELGESLTGMIERLLEDEIAKKNVDTTTATTRPTVLVALKTRRKKAG
jgi:hypothetical protein